MEAAGRGGGGGALFKDNAIDIANGRLLFWEFMARFRPTSILGYDLPLSGSDGERAIEARMMKKKSRQNLRKEKLLLAVTTPTKRRSSGYRSRPNCQLPLNLKARPPLSFRYIEIP